MMKEIRMPNDELTNPASQFRNSGFVILSSFGIRHSTVSRVILQNNDNYLIAGSSE